MLGRASNVIQINPENKVVKKKTTDWLVTLLIYGAKTHSIHGHCFDLRLSLSHLHFDGFIAIITKLIVHKKN